MSLNVPEGIADILPLTPLQREVLLGGAASDLDGLEPEIVVLHFASLDVDALERAWDAVRRRHAALRLSIHAVGASSTVQVVHREASCPVRRLNWRDVAPEALQGRLADFLRSELADGPPLAQAPAMRLSAALTRKGGLVAWTFSPLALDRLSVCLAIDELLSEYGRQLLPEFARVEVSVSPDPYRAIVEASQATDASDARAWWRERFADAAPAPITSGPALSRKIRRRDEALSTNLSEALRAFARKRDANLETLLLAAWSLTLARQARERDGAREFPARIVVGISVSGRPEGDEFLAAMGPFGHVLPFPVGFPHDLPVAAWVDRLHGLRRELQRRQAYPLAEARRWIGASDDDPLFDSTVDAAPFSGAQLRRRRKALAKTLPRPAAGVAKVLVPPRLTERRAVEVRLDERRGELAIRLAWSPERHDDADAERWIEGLRASLQSLVAKSGETVAALLAARPNSVAVALSAGNDERATPLYLVHPAGGEIDCYAALAQRLGKRRPVIALEAAEWMGVDSPTPTIEAMSERLADEILSDRPKERIALAGWSFGGTLAYAVAERLARRGRPASALMLIDASYPTPGDASKPRLSSQKALQRLAAQRGWPVPRKLPPGTDARQLAEQLLKRAVRKERASSDRTPRGLLRQAELFAEHVHAARRYRPPTYAGPTLFVRPADAEEDADEAGWEQVASNLTIVEVEGTHRTMLQPSSVPALADTLEAFLERVAREGGDVR